MNVEDLTHIDQLFIIKCKQMKYNNLKTNIVRVDTKNKS